MDRIKIGRMAKGNTRAETKPSFIVITLGTVAIAAPPCVCVVHKWPHELGENQRQSNMSVTAVYAFCTHSHLAGGAVEIFM